MSLFPSEWKHDPLAADLAKHLFTERRMIWLDIQLGSAHSPRPDVFAMFKSYTQPKPTAYEVKVSRADFLSDVTSGKWMSYLKFAESVVFCVPHGLVKKTEIPTGCGLMVRSERGWSTARKATRQNVRPPFEAMMKLLMDSEHKAFRAHREKSLHIYQLNKKLKGSLGRDVGKFLSDVAMAQETLNSLEERKKQVEQDIEDIMERIKSQVKSRYEQTERRIEEFLKDAREITGLDEQASTFDIFGDLKRLLRVASKDERFALIERTVTNMRQSLSSMEKALDVTRNATLSDEPDDEESAA
jgi:hypothetical protein